MKDEDKKTKQLLIHIESAASEPLTLCIPTAPMRPPPFREEEGDDVADAYSAVFEQLERALREMFDRLPLVYGLWAFPEEAGTFQVEHHCAESVEWRVRFQYDGTVEFFPSAYTTPAAWSATSWEEGAHELLSELRTQAEEELNATAVRIEILRSCTVSPVPKATP